MIRRLLLLVLLAGCPAAVAPVDGGRPDAGGADAGPTEEEDAGVDAGCDEAWTCGAWDITDAGIASRTCRDSNACGTTALRPPVGPAPLPALDFPYYQCEVQPVLEKGCAQLGCHGTETERSLRLYARGRLRHAELVPDDCADGGLVDLATVGTATVQCAGAARLTATEWRRNFDRARAFTLGGTKNELLTFVHANVTPMTDAGYAVLKAWASGSTAAVSCDAGFN